MENPNHKWRFIAGKIIYKCFFFFSMAMLNNQMVPYVVFVGALHLFFLREGMLRWGRPLNGPRKLRLAMLGVSPERAVTIRAALPA